MGSGHSTETIHHYKTEYVPDPETVKALEEAQANIEKLEEEARVMGDPNHFSNNVGKLFDNFVEKIGTLDLTDLIEKADGETHLGFVGPVTAGKTTLANVLFETTRPTALGHCTSECEVIYSRPDLVVWDMPGEDNSFKYYDPATLSFIKGLDRCVILFDSDISVVSWIIKTIYAINPDAMMIIRTKVDQCTANSERTVEEETKRDGEKVQELLGLESPFQTYSISAHNIMNGVSEHFNWDSFVIALGIVPTGQLENDVPEEQEEVAE